MSESYYAMTAAKRNGTTPEHEMESPIYRQIIAEKLKLEKKQTKGTKKGKRKNG